MKVLRLGERRVWVSLTRLHEFLFARRSLSQVRATLETPWFGRTVIIIIIIAACNPCDYVIYIFMFRNNSLLADEEAKTIRELRSWDSLGLLL